MFKTIFLSAVIIASFPKVVAQPVVTYDWNSISFTEGEQIHTEVHSKWVSYLEEDGSWQGIDTNFHPVEGGFAMTKAPFKAFAPQFSDGEAVFHNNNRWDVKNKEVVEDPPLDMTIKALEVKRIEGRIMRSDLVVSTGLQKNVNYVLYENAYSDADLIYYIDFGKEPRLMKLIQFHQKPKKFKYQFIIKYSDDLNFGGVNWKKGEQRIFRGENNSITVFKKGSDVRGIGFWKFRIWDNHIAQGDEIDHMETIKVRMKYLGDNTFLQTKMLRKGFFKDVEYPVYTDLTVVFYPDADAETATVDGAVIRAAADETFATLRSSAGSSATDSLSTIAFAIRASATTAQYSQMGRAVLLFDASSITDTNTINSASLGINASTLSNGLSGNASANSAMVAVATTTASNTALAAGDFDDVFTVGTTDFGRSGAQNTITTGVYTGILLNASGVTNISLTAVSKFALRQGWDFDATTTGLTWASLGTQGYTLVSAEAAGTSTDPKLDINHTPSSGRSHRAVLMQTR